MSGAATEGQWQQLADEVWADVAAWRAQHPTATLREIEGAVDERLAGLRARLVQDTALASRAADLAASEDRPPCPDCGARTVLDGTRVRSLTTTHNREVRLTRSHTQCPACGAGFFPP